MRILMINNEYPPLGGGTGTVNQALLRHFANMPDISIDLITSAGKYPSHIERYSPNITIQKIRDGRTHIHHATNRDLIGFAWQAWKHIVVHHTASSYDLVFAWSTLPAGLVAWAISQRFKLPYVVRVSGPDIPGFEERYRWLYPFLTPVIRFVWKRANRTIAKCQDEVNMIHAVEPGLHVEIIPNGVDINQFSNNSRPAQQSPIPSPMQVLCVARLIERKGQRTLIQAIKRMVDQSIPVHLHLVGDGDSRQAYTTLVSHLGIQDYVSFHGYVPREDIHSYYANADVFVLLSSNEGMSVATLEAMASGLPIVASHAGGMDHLVVPGSNGFLVDWQDVDGLLRVLQQLAQNRSLLYELGKSARERASMFTWESAAQAYKEMFNQLQGLQA